MKKLSISLILFVSVLTGSSLALETEDPADGNRISEPRLADYSEGTRTPGFSPITDVQYR